MCLLYSQFLDFNFELITVNSLCTGEADFDIIYAMNFSLYIIKLKYWEFNATILVTDRLYSMLFRFLFLIGRLQTSKVKYQRINSDYR